MPKIGDKIDLDENLLVEVLSADENASDNNGASIILRVEYGNISFLLTGLCGYLDGKGLAGTYKCTGNYFKSGTSRLKYE